MSDHAGDLDRYLRILAGASPAGRLIEIRSATPHGGMRQTFTPATRPDLAARTISQARRPHRRVRRRAASPPPRRRPRRLRALPPRVRRDRPTPTPSSGSRNTAARRAWSSASGGTAGHAHAYWQLQQPVEPRRARASQPPTRDPPRRRPRLRRRRPHPETANLVESGSAPRRRASSCSCYTPPAGTTLAELTAGLTDPSPPRRSTTPSNREAASELDRQLLAIPAATYVPALTGRQPNRAGKIHCPFHDDHNPSLQLYEHGLVLLRSLPHRRLHLRLRRASLRPRHPRPRLPRAPPAPRRQSCCRPG